MAVHGITWHSMQSMAVYGDPWQSTKSLLQGDYRLTPYYKEAYYRELLTKSLLLTRDNSFLVVNE